MAKVKLEPLTDREQANASPLIMKMKGTPEWCWQTLEGLKRDLELINKRYNEVDDQLADIKKYEVWNIIPPEKPYGSLDAMLKAELGTNAESLSNKIHDLRSQGRPKKGEEKGAIGTFKRGSNSRDYILARLKRDRQDLYIRVLEGEISAHTAAIEAGFIKAPDPLQQILGLLPKLSKEETQKLINAAAEALARAPAKPVENKPNGKAGCCNKGKIWITNGEERRRVDPALPIPEGWIAGRAKQNAKEH